MQSDLFGNVPEIVIDTHETGGKGKNAVKHLMSMLDKEQITYSVQKIPIGDVLGVDGIAIERKTVNDLVNTLKGSSAGVPRLTKQLDALLEYDKPYVLIENILAIRRDPMKKCIYIPFSTKQTKGKPYFVTMERASYIHPSSLDALIESISERGIQVIKGFNALHSAGLLYGILVGNGDKRKQKGQRLPVIRTRKGLDSMNDEQEFFIAGFPGVNVVRARSLLERFGSPQEAILQIDDWGKIPGIGPKTIASAKKLLFSDYEINESETSENDENTSDS
ncbi:MAG: ERCC4 domain-containing protein [Candidatus Thorarchaeota archaeon]|jgi:Fanconi anemia group M protein